MVETKAGFLINQDVNFDPFFTAAQSVLYRFQLRAKRFMEVSESSKITTTIMHADVD